MTLSDYILCPHNQATNRQVRMLSNSSCSGFTSDHEMLQTALQNLKQMTYFGIFEYPRESMQLLQWTFPGLNPQLQQEESRIDQGAVDVIHA